MDIPLEMQPDGSYEIPSPRKNTFSVPLNEKMAILRRYNNNHDGGIISKTLYAQYCAQFDSEIEKTIEECNELLKKI